VVCPLLRTQWCYVVRDRATNLRVGEHPNRRQNGCSATIWNSCRALAPGGLHHVVAGSLPSIDVNGLTCDKPGAIEIDNRVHNVGHLSHPTHRMERRQRLMRFRRVHRRLDYSR
jgi:hypothetical protein